MAKRKSITAAAEGLCISQPAVSLAIKTLEEELLCKLFFRKPRGVELTEEGKLFFSYVEKGYVIFEQGEKSLNKMLNLEQGEIWIGASDMTLKYYLLPFLQRFHKEYPGIKVKVTNRSTPETLKNLEEGKIDFGVVSDPLPIREEFLVNPVMEIEDIFVASNSFSFLKDQCLEFQELQELPIVCLEKNTSSRGFVDHYLEKMGLKIEPEFELATSDLIVQFALQGMGVGMVVELFARESLMQGSLFQLKLKDSFPKRKICLVSRKKESFSSAAKALYLLLLS